MELVKTPASWEYLENNAIRFAKALGDPPPEVVIQEGVFRMNMSAMRGKIPIDPGVLAVLDLEESAFYVAYMLVVTRVVKEYFGGPLRMFNPAAGFKVLAKHWKPRDLIHLVLVVPVTAVVFIFLRWRLSHGEAPTFLSALGIVVALVAVQLPFQWQLMRRIQSSYFEGAVALAGNREAGKSFYRKILTFYRTGRGTRPLTGLRKRLVDWSCRLGTAEP